MTAAQHVRAVLCGTLILLSLAAFCIPLAGLALLRLASASPVLRRSMNRLYRWAVAWDDWCLAHISGVAWQLPALDLDPDRACLVLCNHRSWSDVFVVQSTVSRNGPIIVFLAKRELAYIPIFGIICWAFGFPLLRRRARGSASETERREADRQRVRHACGAVRQAPAAILDFAEGTRFTEAKRQRAAQGLGAESPYQHLLPPKPGGFAAMYEGLDGVGAAIVDLTLAYAGDVTLWRFLGGATAVSVSATVYQWEDIANRDLAAWLRGRWVAKDRELAAASEGGPWQPASADR